MTGRRARRAYRPVAAFWWGTAKVCALLGASTALGVSLSLVGAEAVFHGRWEVTADAASVAFAGVFLGALAAVFHALMVHAIDGPLVYRPSPDFPDDQEEPADDWAGTEDYPMPGELS